MTDEQGLGLASRECALAARYVDVFGATIDRELAPARWPSILVLDAKPFWLRGYGAAEHAEHWHQGERAGTALVAVGGEDPDRLAAWRIGFAGDGTTASWSDFLAELPGEPAFVVTDGSEAIRLAVRRRWPKANLYACEYHLSRALREAAEADGIWPDDPRHARRFERALWSDADWTALAELALEANTPALLRWVNANDPLVRRQLALRARFPGYPRSNAAAERVADALGAALPRRRRYSLRNARRLTALFGLIRAEVAGQLEPIQLGGLVKRELAALPAPFAIDWSVLVDPRTEPCSITKLLIAARDRGRRDTAAYMASAKTRSVPRLLRDGERGPRGGRPRAAGGQRPPRAADGLGRCPRPHPARLPVGAPRLGPRRERRARTGPPGSGLEPGRALALEGVEHRAEGRAAADRLLHHAHVIVTEGRSHRLAEALDGRGVRALANAEDG